MYEFLGFDVTSSIYFIIGLSKDIPEYSDFDYFVMIFTTGFSSGFLQDAIAGPIPLFKDNTGEAINYWGS